MPFDDGDGNIREEDEPRDGVQTPVEDMRHVEKMRKDLKKG